jgi:hypothetical protein
MMQNRFYRTAITTVPALCALLLLFGCEGPRRQASPAAEPPRDVQPEAPQPPSAALTPATAPSPPAVARKPESPKPPPSTAEPISQPIRPFEPPTPPAAEELPPYIQVLERFRPLEPATVHIDSSSPQRLVIDTSNVRRIWIDRERAQLALNRSVVLRLDGQGIEWTADSRTREFERSKNGVWEAAHERIP